MGTVASGLTESLIILSLVLSLNNFKISFTLSFGYTFSICLANSCLRLSAIRFGISFISFSPNSVLILSIILSISSLYNSNISQTEFVLQK